MRCGSYIYNILLFQIVFKARLNLPCWISPVNDVGIIKHFLDLIDLNKFNK